MPTEIAMTINGNPVSVSVDEDETLLHTLRNRLGLRATRFGCGEEACGACTVLIEGAAEYSCTRRSVDVQGCRVLTADGLEPNGPLISAFVAEQAGQCGYCLTGILMSAAALLMKPSQPGRSDIVAALERHLCRCGAHRRIVRAIERAAADVGCNT
jgi:nicotinate dehydrogenase subunit A